MPLKIDEASGKLIYRMKAIAIFLVVAAHSTAVGENAGVANQTVSQLWRGFMAISVTIFFLFAGYLLFYEHRTFGKFTLRKLETIGIPWLFCGTLVYLYVYLRKGGLSLLSYVLWLLGVETYLYYLTELLLLYLLMFFFRKNKVVTWIALGGSLLVKVLEDIFSVSFAFSSFDIPHALLYFSAGLLIAQYGVLERIIGIAGKIWIPCGCIYISLAILRLFVLDRSSKLLYEFIFIIGILFFIGVCSLATSKGNFMIEIGRLSFPVYLLHMPIAGIVANLCNRVDWAWLTAIRPFIAFIIVYLLVLWAKLIAVKIKILRAPIAWLTAIK